MHNLISRTLPVLRPRLLNVTSSFVPTTYTATATRSISFVPQPPSSHTRPNPNKALKIDPAKRHLAREPAPPPTITAEELAKRPYAVRRTAFGQLPIYRNYKSGGTQIQIMVKKVNGDKGALISEFTDKLGIARERVRINPTTAHIEVKGDYFDSVRAHILERGF